jgi:DUF4097 and DUF4098 domain-containing protein YvlB
MRTATYETPGPLRLNLELPVGRIEIETVEGTTTHVELEAVTADMGEVVEHARIDCRERGNGHEVVVEVQSRFGIFISFGRSQDIRLRITCPPGADLNVMTKSADLNARGRYGDVEMKTASGDGSIEEALGSLRFKSASGDLHAERVRGSANVQTASGDVAFFQTDGDVTVQLVSGDLWVRDARASVSANTVSGDQKLDAVSAGTMELRAVSGDIMIGIRRGARVFVDANTVSGSTTSELDLSDAPVGDEPAEPGAVVEVRAKTISGDIAVTRAPAMVETSSS